MSIDGIVTRKTGWLLLAVALVAACGKTPSRDESRHDAESRPSKMSEPTTSAPLASNEVPLDDTPLGLMNRGVMAGVEGRLAERYALTKRACERDPNLAIAAVYLGDTLCRWGMETKEPSLRSARFDEAIESYLHGYELEPNQTGLVAMGLQCLWDAGLFKQPRVQDGLTQIGKKHPDSWLQFLFADMQKSGKQNGGLDSTFLPTWYRKTAPSPTN